MNRKFILAGSVLCLFHAAFGQTQLIVNGGFESGAPTPWVFFGTGASIGTDSRFARTGTRYLTMGSVANANQTVSQTLVIPTNTAVAVLNYYWAVLSSDNAGIDQLKVWIVGTNAASTNLPIILATVDQESNSSSRGVYFQKSFDLTPYVGQTISVYFAMTSDPVNGALTTFYIDDVTVQAGTSADIPPNDDFVNRAALSGSSATVSATNTFASKEPGEPNHGGNAGGRSLWWKWTATTGGTVTLNTSGSFFNTLLGVYTGSVVSNLSLIVSNNGVFQSTGTAQVKFNATVGTEYEIAVDGYNGTIGKLVLNLSFAPDTKAPTVSFTSPAAGAKVTNSTVVVQGKASDNLAVALVQYRLENAAGTNDYQTASGTNNWSATVTNLIPGPNTVRVRALDTSTNVSPAVARSFTFVVVSPLTLTANGNGTVSPNLNGQLLAVGSSYTVTAKPGAGSLFSGWTGDVVSALAKLTFIMQSNMVFQANFIPNPFLPLVGTYQGLFYETNGVALQSSGFFTATLKSSGACSAKATVAGKSYSLSGRFATDGSYSNSFARPGLTPLTVQLQLDLAGDTLSGQLSDGVATAQLRANRAVFSKTQPAPQAGKYTLLIPGAEESEDAPGGDSIGAVTVDSAGNVTISGTLADGTRLSQKAFVSSQGLWAFYASLYKGGGVALGWLTFTNLAGTEIDGLVSWIKLPQAAAKFYRNGFTNETEAVASRYVFTNGVPVLNVSTGQVWLANGNLPQSFTNQIVLGANNKVTGTTNNVSLSITTSSGLFKGSVPDPATGKGIQVNGVVLQKQNFGGGQFLGTNQAGRVHLEP